MPSGAGVVVHRWSRSALFDSSGRTLLAVAIGVVLTVASFLPSIVVVVVVAGLAVGFAIGWPRLVGLPSLHGSTVVIGATGLFAIAAVLVTGTLVPLIAVLGFAVVAAFLHEMVRRDGRPRLVESLAGTVTGSVVTASAGGWVVVSGAEPPAVLVTATAAALTLAAAAELVPFEPQYRFGVVVAIGVAAGIGASQVLSGLGLATGVAVGVGAGLFTAAVRQLFDHYPSSGRPSASSAIAVLPACALGIPVYAIGVLFAG